MAVTNAEPPPLQPLQDAQLHASDPAGDVWLSASAGTGKTHVLTARVLRLLLKQGLDPSTILCLTFTKAGAAEMAERVQSRLARWVRLDEPALRRELFALGEAHDDPRTVARARTLFARVLEVPGGLRIGTIHAFAGSLLASFPAEAGLTPGFRPMEPREEAVLARATLADMVLAAERDGDTRLLAALQTAGLRLGEGGAEAWLRRCARAPDAMEALPEDIAAYVAARLDVPEEGVEAYGARACADHPFGAECLTRIAAANRAWGTATGLKAADAIDRWTALEPDARAAALADVAGVVLTRDGGRRKASAKLLAHDPDYDALVEELASACAELAGMADRAELAAALAAGLEAGRAYARAYAEAKRREGLVDFDDLILRVGQLLAEPGMGAWIRYALDQATDHILVDEGQDTNARQWSIVGTLASEFFATARVPGETERLRTLFTVGDHKQAIFGFQGTDPIYFRAAEERFARLAEPSEEAAERGARPMARLSLNRSFRSTPAVLEAVDAMIGALGADALGLDALPPAHESARGGAGAVELWPPVSIAEADDGSDGGEEGWIDDATRRFATQLADQVAAWLRDGLWLAARKRALQPQDVMILVRRRGELASLIVARLHAAGVPVAGVDRLRLAAPLAVRDLLAAARFAVQPRDSLSLAALLVSPLIGWNQDRLMTGALRGRDIPLWRHLRDTADAGTVETLRGLLSLADLVTPYQFFERILSGPMAGRRRLLERLGEEARDPIDELLNAAIGFERLGTVGLQRFLDWFDRDEVEIVRDPSQPLDAVRVMTVHGAKGLQAPLVVLADATIDPERSPRRELLWAPEEGLEALPVFRPRKAELTGSLATTADEADRRERQEHWRLLYVAATRAEERLVIGGALGPAAKGTAPVASWHAVAADALATLGAGERDDPRWGRVLVHGNPPPPRAPALKPHIIPQPTRPAWLDRPAPQEQRPPRPLAPSAIGEDLSADPPPGPALRAAAERGRLLHALFERLPSLPAAIRRETAVRWLRQAMGVADDGRAVAVVDDALRVIGDGRFAALFSPHALAEAPLAATVDGRVIAGTVDRLLIEPGRVTVVDFKTGRRAPAAIGEVAPSHLRQMGAYAAALGIIFPGRTIEAALLYTAGPTLIRLDEATLATHHPARLSGEGARPT